MKPTLKEITEAMKELHNAMIESFEADKAEENAKLRKMKAHKSLSLAKDTVRSLTFN